MDVGGCQLPLDQKNSRRLWRSRRRNSRRVPEGGADFPAAIFLAGKCANLGRDSIWSCRKIGEEFSSCAEVCRKTCPAGFRTATAFSSFQSPKSFSPALFDSFAPAMSNAVSTTISNFFPPRESVSWAHALLKGANTTESQKIQDIIPRRKDVSQGRNPMIQIPYIFWL